MSNLIHFPHGQLALNREIETAAEALAQLRTDTNELKSQEEDFRENGIRIPDGLKSAIKETEVNLIQTQSRLKALCDLRELAKTLKR
ncbi:hypothetical protein [Sphingobium sp. LSP13-1-1.1]|uniref:hypothetical protein n=1 Tax=Sphingobium sp. LSP13-1-1.1 TaxID=3135234 RepID=UPI0034455B63